MINMGPETNALRRLIWLRGNPATGGVGSPLTVSGPTPLLMPGAVAKPLKKATFAIEPVQSGSGDPSPSNVRPITGWTAANVTVSGRNLLDPTKIVDGYMINAAPNGSEPIGSTHKYGAYSYCDFISVFPNTAYTITYPSNTLAGIAGLVYYTDENENGVISGVSLAEQGSITYSFTTPANCHYIRFSWPNTSGNNVMFEPGSTPSPYTPYSGSSLSVEFPASVGTVYSGTIDPVTGEGVVTHKCVTFDGTETGWNNYGNPTNGFALNPGDMKTGTRLAGMSNWLKVPTSAQASGTPYCYLGFGNAYIYITDVIGNVGSVSDMASWKAYLTEHPLQVVYPLATPIPFTVTPHELRTIQGDNYIWADCGSTAEVTYIGKA